MMDGMRKDVDTKLKKVYDMRSDTFKMVEGEPTKYPEWGNVGDDGIFVPTFGAKVMRSYDIQTDEFNNRELNDAEKNSAVLEDVSKEKELELRVEYAYLVDNGYQGKFWEYVIWEYKKNG